MKKINIHFFVLFFISLVVSISDIIIYFANPNFAITNLIVGIVFFIMMILIIKRNRIEIKFDFKKYDLIFLIPFLLFALFSIVFPDLSWDTRSYHIYLQENVFIDKINSDFFAGRNLNSFLFALGDRIHYLFRYCLGYRLGTLMSFYLVIILYYQIKNFLRNFFTTISEFLISFISIFPAMVAIIFSYIGTYYIDNFSVVFLLEIFFIALFEKDVLEDKIKLYILGILVGLAISIKITNIIFIALIGIYFLISNIKELKYLKIYDYFIFGILMILPWFIYGYDNYIQTGNPVFPYYNNIFKSEFFMEESWVDDNFGPKNLVQFIIWPIYIVFYPLAGFDTKFVDITWLVGFVSICIYILYSIITRNIKENKLFTLSIITLLNYYLWEKLLIGYVRYASILLILSMIVSICVIEKIYIKYQKIGICFFILFIISCMPSLGYDLLIKVKDFENVNQVVSEYKMNVSNIYKDKNNQKVKVDGILGAIGDDSLIPTLVRYDDKIYNLEEWVTITNSKTEDMYKEKIYDKEIYVLVDELTKERKEDYLARNNFEILDVYELEDEFNFLKSNEKMFLYVVEKVQ